MPRCQSLRISRRRVVVASRLFTAAALLFCSACAASAADNAGQLVILPGKIELASSEARLAPLAERVDAVGMAHGHVSKELAWSVDDPKVAVLEDGILRPTGNGTTKLRAKFGNESAEAPVTVRNMDKPFTWSFRNHVESVLAKAGCSTGPCHGAQAGKGGFKISLLGYDSAGDHSVITRQARGRRVVLSDPGHSLLLTKPTGLVPHKGGVRFKDDSIEYRVLAEWIAAGAPAPRDDDPRIERLEILPSQAQLRPGEKQPLLVLAHFTDGRVEDITRWARYTSTNESVNQVSDRGLVSVVGYGEGAITAWYLSKVVVATVAAPYQKEIPAEVFSKAPQRNLIDKLVLEKLKSLNIPPSPPTSDGEFLRRAYLDTIGMLPTVDEVTAFLADKRADKRDRLIESLLHRPEFVDYWSYKWADLLLVNSERLKTSAGEGGDPRSSQMWAYYSWIRRHVEADSPWDAMVRELLTSTGSTLENGAANYFLLHKDPLDLAETTTVAFMGTNINCARCHNHPLEKWTNDQYYQMANMFSRVRIKLTPDGGNVIYAATEGDLVQPLTGKPQPPRPLDGKAVDIDSPADRRVALATWLVGPENPAFARSVTNRVWANFMGIGLVEYVDDMRVTNPATNDKLLSALAHHLVENKYDLKSLMRLILQSATYQRDSRPVPGNEQDRRFYSRYYPRRLMAEVLLDAVSQATGAPTEFKGYPVGWRALQLPDSGVSSYFLETFGRPDRLVTCECERTQEPSMVQVLHISNGETMNNKLQAKGNRIDGWLTAKAKPEQMIEQAYLAALARQPTPQERDKILAVLAESPAAEQRQVIEDLMWGILSSKEFLFNH
ncbi:MAG: DUF1553 domain-containing protein [Planctomycetes bacterium]|nr:DUF1553 domain-containing protein [Planctomycetota bacterium]